MGVGFEAQPLVPISDTMAALQDVSLADAHDDFVALFVDAINASKSGVAAQDHPYGDEHGDLLPGRFVDSYATLCNSLTPGGINNQAEMDAQIAGLRKCVPASLKLAYVLAERHEKTERVIQFFLTFLACFDSDEEEEENCHEEEDGEDRPEAEDDEEEDEEDQLGDDTEMEVGDEQPSDDGEASCFSDME